MYKNTFLKACVVGMHVVDVVVLEICCGMLPESQFGIPTGFCACTLGHFDTCLGLFHLDLILTRT